MSKSRTWGEGLKVLVVGAAPSARPALGRSLEGAGLRVAWSTGPEAEELEREPVSLGVAYSGIGAGALRALLMRSKRRHPEIPFVVLGSTAASDEAVEAMQSGAADYLPERASPEVLLLRLRRLAEALRAGPATPAPPARSSEYAGLIGTSEAMRALFSTIDKVSRYKASVLLLGESGTGKELIARALHARGQRRGSLFVPLNCATLGRELLENELFGHDRGAFTGAHDRKKGLFELADGGTLFLDEIGEMDPATQAKLLRVLERGEFRRVGGTEKLKVDLSVIAATNRNLSDAIASGQFREDLYYRLKVVTIVVPPLRERREDIPALIDAFIADFNRRNNGKIRGIAPQALKQFMEHDWPGNVRELKNAIESSAVMASKETLGDEAVQAALGSSRPRRPAHPAPPEPTPAPPGGPPALPISVGQTLAEAERVLILATVARHPTRAEAARALGIGLRTLYSKLRSYEDPAPSRPTGSA